MSGELVMPKLGLTMSEGTLLEWLVQPHAGGTLIQHEVSAGETVPVGAIVARVTEEEEREFSVMQAQKSVPQEGGAKEQASVASPLEFVERPTVSDSKRIYATPLARRRWKTEFEARARYRFFG